MEAKAVERDYRVRGNRSCLREEPETACLTQFMGTWILLLNLQQSSKPCPHGQTRGKDTPRDVSNNRSHKDV